MPGDRASTNPWDQLADWYVANVAMPVDRVHYGPDCPDEHELRLCGEVAGKRILELGCGPAHNCIAFARGGAKAIGVDTSNAMLTHGRRLAEAAEVKVELRQVDMADLGFMTSASVDLAFSANAFNYVDDLNRLFRQVHRVLKTDAPLVFSLPHPTRALLDADSDQPLLVRRSAFDREPRTTVLNGVALLEYRHSVSELFTALHRANFRVEVLIEPEPVASAPRSVLWREVDRVVPSTLVMRARKLGG